MSGKYAVAGVGLLMSVVLLGTYWTTSARLDSIEVRLRNLEAPASEEASAMTSAGVDPRLETLKSELNRVGAGMENRMEFLAGRLEALELSAATPDRERGGPLAELELPERVYRFEHLPARVRAIVAKRRAANPGAMRADMFYLTPRGFYSHFFTVPTNDMEAWELGADRMRILDERYEIELQFFARQKRERKHYVFENRDEASEFAKDLGKGNSYIELLTPEGAIVYDKTELHAAPDYQRVNDELDHLVRLLLDLRAGNIVSGPEKYVE